MLPLETFRAIIGYHPFHFWQLANETIPVTSVCNTLVYQYPWQSGHLEGRTDILDAIATAESQLTRYLRFSPAPHYVEETHDAPEYLQHGMMQGRADPDGRWLSLTLNEGYIQAVGIEARTLIDTPVVAYTDTDNDTLLDTFTITVATTITDPEELAVYFAAADRLNSAAVSEAWRVAPVSISISGGTATIKGRRWQLVKPVLYEGFAVTATELDPQTAGNFVTTLEVYRYFTNGDGTTESTSQALLTWESYPYPGWACCSGDLSSDPAAIATVIARVGIRNAEFGIVLPGEASYDATTDTWSSCAWSGCRPPDRVTIRYYAGYPLIDGRMAPQWATIVARLAAAELDGPICACEKANRTLYRWQKDLALTGGQNDELLGGISARDLDNPLGTRRGHVYAWRAVTALQHARGFLPG